MLSLQKAVVIGGTNSTTAVDSAPQSAYNTVRETQIICWTCNILVYFMPNVHYIRIYALIVRLQNAIIIRATKKRYSGTKRPPARLQHSARGDLWHTRYILLLSLSGFVPMLTLCG